MRRKVTDQEVREAVERAGSPGGLLESDLFEVMALPEVLEALSVGLLTRYGRRVALDDIKDFVEEWRARETGPE